MKIMQQVTEQLTDQSAMPLPQLAALMALLAVLSQAALLLLCQS